MANTINKIIRNWTEYQIKDTTYTAGTWISIDSSNVISNTQTSAEWWNITGTLSDQTDLNNALGWKQDSLTLPSSPTQWNLVTRWADNETLVDGWAVPTGFNPASAGTTDQILTKTANWYDWGNPPENVKVFELSSTSDLTTAQDAYNWYVSWWTPIIRISGEAYNCILITQTSSVLDFWYTKPSTVTGGYWTYSLFMWVVIRFNISSWTVTSIVKNVKWIWLSNAAPASWTSMDYITIVI